MREGALDDQIEWIAEIGLNHNGQVELAKRTIEAAHLAGATTVKFQTYDVTERVPAGHPVASILEDCKLTPEEFAELKDFSEGAGLVFLTTVFGLSSLEVAKQLGLNRVKIASFSIANFELIQAALSAELSLVISTGASNWSEVIRCAGLLHESAESDHIFLHCISQYPVAEMTNLNLINVGLLAEQTGFRSGFSDHTAGSEASFYAALVGARTLEKHFTVDQSLPGPDHAFSATPEIFLESVERAGLALDILGVPRVGPYSTEEMILPFRVEKDAPGATG